MRFLMALLGGMVGGGLVLAMGRAAKARSEGDNRTPVPAATAWPPTAGPSVPVDGHHVSAIPPARNRKELRMLRKLKWPFATKRRAVLSSVAVVALVMASVGLAAWLLTVNAGSGRGQAGSISNPVITNVTPAPGDQCMPAAGTTCSVSVSVNNPNTVALKLTAINFNGGSAKIEKPLGTDASGACSSSNITGPINKTGLNIDLPAGATTTVVVPAVWGLAANAPVGCMGVFVYFGLGSSGTDWTIST